MTRNFPEGSITWTAKFKEIGKKFLVAIVYTLAMAGIVVLLLLINLMFKIQHPTSDNDLAILQNFIEWFAVIYTLTLSLIMTQAWARYNSINSEVDREADALSLLCQTADMVENPRLGENLSRAVRIYTNFVRNPRNKDGRVKSEALEKIEVIQICINKIVADDETKDCVKSELMRHYADFYDARNDRFDLLGQLLPLRVWLLLGVFSLAWLWGFFWLRFDSKSLLIYIISCTVFSITVLFGYALDMNNPYAGFWRINLSSFKDNRY